MAKLIAQQKLSNLLKIFVKYLELDKIRRFGIHSRALFGCGYNLNQDNSLCNEEFLLKYKL